LTLAIRHYTREENQSKKYVHRFRLILKKINFRKKMIINRSLKNKK